MGINKATLKRLPTPRESFTDLGNRIFVHSGQTPTMSTSRSSCPSQSSLDFQQSEIVNEKDCFYQYIAQCKPAAAKGSP